MQAHHSVTLRVIHSWKPSVLSSAAAKLAAYCLSTFLLNSYQRAFWSFPHQIKSPTLTLPSPCSIIQRTFKIKRVLSLQTASLGPMELSAAKRATAKVAYVTGRQALASHSSSLPKSPASSGVSRKQVSVITDLWAAKPKCSVCKQAKAWDFFCLH